MRASPQVLTYEFCWSRSDPQQGALFMLLSAPLSFHPSDTFDKKHDREIYHLRGLIMEGPDLISFTWDDFNHDSFYDSKDNVYTWLDIVKLCDTHKPLCLMYSKQPGSAPWRPSLTENEVIEAVEEVIGTRLEPYGLLMSEGRKARFEDDWNPRSSEDFNSNRRKTAS